MKHLENCRLYTFIDSAYLHGRDPAEIMTSTHLWVDPAQPVDPASIAAQAEAYVGSGLDLAIVYLHAPYDPSVVAPIAEALAPLAD